MRPILIIQNCPDESPGTIIDWLNLTGLEYFLIKSYETTEFPPLDEIEAVICLGCPHSAMNIERHEFLQKLYAYIQSIAAVNKHYLGICFGAQIMAKALGAEVSANDVKEIGVYDIKLTDSGLSHSLFHSFPAGFKVFHWHGDTFEIPDGALLLATGDACVNQAFAIGKIYGLQFHLEADPNEVPSWCNVYANELEETGKNKADIVGDYQKVSNTIRELNFRLLNNFIIN